MLNKDDKFFEHPVFNFIITLRVKRKQAMLIIFEMICFGYKCKKCKNILRNIWLRATVVISAEVMQNLDQLCIFFVLKLDAIDVYE